MNSSACSSGRPCGPPGTKRTSVSPISTSGPSGSQSSTSASAAAFASGSSAFRWSSQSRSRSPRGRGSRPGLRLSRVAPPRPRLAPGGWGRGATGGAGSAGPPPLASKPLRIAMRPAGVHHVDLVVSSIERSLPFYRELLGPLGWHGVSEVQSERGETIWYLWGPGSSIGLREAQTGGEGPYDRYRVGLHHLALEAGTRGA